MLMEGCWLVGVSERGACGFSNERSLTYCASTASCGIAICGWGPPFVVDIAVLQPTLGAFARLANTGLAGEQWRSSGHRPGRRLPKTRLATRRACQAYAALPRVNAGTGKVGVAAAIV